MWFTGIVGWEIGYVGDDHLNRWKFGFFLLAGLIAAGIIAIMYFSMEIQENQIRFRREMEISLDGRIMC